MITRLAEPTSNWGSPLKKILPSKWAYWTDDRGKRQSCTLDQRTQSKLYAFISQLTHFFDVLFWFWLGESIQLMSKSMWFKLGATIRIYRIMKTNKSVIQLPHMPPLRPESSENIPILLQEADLYFSNQNDLRNPKMGSKQSVVVATEGWFFQITFLGRKNHRKNRTVSLLIHSLVILTP